MKKNLFSLVALPAIIFAQGTDNAGKYPNTFSSGSPDVQVWNSAAKKYNDWSISVGGGAAFIAHGDLTSFRKDHFKMGWNAYGSIDKQLTHEFGVSVMYQMGKTEQTGQLPMPYGAKSGVAEAWTKYKKLTIMGDANLTELFRRVYPSRDYNLALHAYAGIGMMGYETELVDKYLSPASRPIKVDQPLNMASFVYDLGLGLKYKLTSIADLELRALYTFTGDEEFDGGGDERMPTGSGSEYTRYNLINDSYADNMLNVSLGLSFKLGKHDEHLQWIDPMQDIYSRTDALMLKNSDAAVMVCTKGDLDNDAVCDDWDRELNTPAGARVDGAGRALDMDLDGVIDLYDKCPTQVGPASNNGCPQ